MSLIEDPELNEVSALGEVVPAFSGLHVLEIGCGDGRLTRRYATEAASVVAIDPDAGAIEDLRRALPHVDARAMGIEQLALPPHSVDVLLFAWSL
ncbi:MAG TPA: class I SAM-dependent methyltransferase [Vicinamibacterales bacterium]|nr:class I SAM-dependent methyltransferase [Vicinamibacterales bacterium]